MTRAAADRSVRVGALRVDAVTLAGALDAVEALVRARRGGAVFTPNVDHVVLAEHHRAFAGAYARADLSLADGMPVVWATRWLGRPVPEKVSGSDLVLPLLERAAARGFRVYLLGGGPGAAEEAMRRLARALPHLVVCGHAAPRIDERGDPSDWREVARAASATRPDLVLVALGAPKQELFIDACRDELAPAVALGLGASLDFLAGRVRRAPGWVSRAGLEWAWRLSREPRRLWRRYLLRDPEFAAILARQWRRERGGDGRGDLRAAG